MTMDVDSTTCDLRVHGRQKQGARFGCTKVRGLHLLLATRADTGEVLHTRMCKGSANRGRGAKRFVSELGPGCGGRATCGSRSPCPNTT
jgi:hypothetical protein